MEKKYLIGIIAAVAVIAIFVATLVYYSNVIEEGYHYTYQGADGSDYSFDVVRLEGINGLFHKAYFSLGRDDGKIYKYYTMFRNSPMDLEQIPLEKVSSDILYNKDEKKKQIDVTQNPGLPSESGKISSLAVLDITKITGSMGGVTIFGVPTKMAFTSLTPDMEGTEIKEIDCSDASDDTGVILLRIGDANKIYRENENCVILEAKSYADITKVSDKFVMHLIGIF